MTKFIESLLEDEPEEYSNFVWRIARLVSYKLEERQHPLCRCCPPCSWRMIVWRFADRDGRVWWVETEPELLANDDDFGMSATPWVESLLGRELREGDAVDFDELIGRPLAIWTPPDHAVSDEAWECSPLDGLVRA